MLKRIGTAELIDHIFSVRATKGSVTPLNLPHVTDKEIN